MHTHYFIFILTVLLTFSSCKKNGENDPSGPGGGVDKVVTISSDLCWDITTEKAIYAPGSTIRFTADGTPTDNTRVRYRSGSRVIADEVLSANTWEWTAPKEDGVGYLVEVYRAKDEWSQTVVGTIGVDVSSTWQLYPRYGFVATFDASKTDAVITSEMEYLNRCHINGVQFQDWHWKHHYPAPVEGGRLLETFKDIANRDNSTDVIRRYIAAQHAYGMKSIFYNLCFGALDDAVADGVKMKEWGLYCDPTHSNQDKHSLPSSWKSDIFLLDPGNKDWHRYLADRNEEVYTHFDFDGFQIDQLGHRGDRYNFSGSSINFNTAYASFINAMYNRHPDKELIMNAVGSFGSEAILKTGHMLLAYNECWEYEDKFSDLRNIVKANDVYSGNKAKTVFAAYMNYKMDNCEFNVPGVLLTDAVMFALGGAHLELGDHMLCREYFPYTGVRMSDGLKEQIIHYYDFLTAYEHLLRGGDKEETLAVSADASKGVGIVAWPPKLGKIVTYGRVGEDRHILHLLNFLNANSLSWRDMEGKQSAPRVVNKLPLEITVADKVNHVYVASPDYHGGALQELPFHQENGKVSVTIPSLKYWDMIILE